MARYIEVLCDEIDRVTAISGVRWAVSRLASPRGIMKPGRGASRRAGQMQMRSGERDVVREIIEGEPYGRGRNRVYPGVCASITERLECCTGIAGIPSPSVSRRGHLISDPAEGETESGSISTSYPS